MIHNLPCALIPVYNHPTTIRSVCDAMTALGLPVILVDDGCDSECANVLDDLQAAGHHLVRHVRNQGKGAAIRSGLIAAAQLGFTHALQIDADAQHDIRDIPAFLEQSRHRPGTLLVGYPRYDDSVPRARFYGRYATHIWVWINTLSMTIRDSMCGVRLYPIAALNHLLKQHACGDRMTFDTEVLVRWHWAGLPLANLAVSVHYPEDGVSHFAVWRDNVQISAMHTKLFFGMLWRAPALLARRWRNRRPTGTNGASHWASIGERGTLTGMLFMVRVRRRLGRWPFRVVLWPVIAWYFLSHRMARRASINYLEHIEPTLARRPLARLARSFRHFLTFGDALMDKVDAWSGQIPYARLAGAGIQDFNAAAISGKGGILLVAHHGNLDVVNALAERHPSLDLTVVLHTRRASRFNELLERATGLQRPQVVEASEMTPGTAQTLAERVHRGGLVVIAADRQPISSGRVRSLAFLDAQAEFPEGPFVLTALLRCPLYYLGCVRNGHQFDIDLTPLATAEDVSRRDRDAWIDDSMQRYVAHLSGCVQEYPLQWFNFFPFWQQE